jgi:hypothetical protein
MLAKVEVAMLFTTPLAISVFLLGAASGALLVTLRYLAFRNRIHSEVAEDLRRALFRKQRERTSDGRGVSAAESDSYGVAAQATDDRVGWP